MSHQPETESESPSEPIFDRECYNQYVGIGVAHKSPPNRNFKNYNLAENCKSSSILRVDSPTMSQESDKIDIEPKSIDVFTGDPVSDVQKDDEIVEDSQLTTIDNNRMRLEGEEEEEEASLEIEQSSVSSSSSVDAKKVEYLLKQMEEAEKEDSKSFETQEAQPQNHEDIDDNVAIETVNAMTSPFLSPSPKRSKIATDDDKEIAKPLLPPIYKRRENVDDKSQKLENLSLVGKCDVKPGSSDRVALEKCSPKTPTLSPHVVRQMHIPVYKPKSITPIKKLPQIPVVKPPNPVINLNTSPELEAYLDKCEQEITCFDPQLKNENDNNFVMTNIDGINQTTSTQKMKYMVTQKWFCQDDCDDGGPTICMDYKRLYNCYKSQYKNGYLVFETLLHDLSDIDLDKRKSMTSLYSYYQMKSANGEGYETLELFLFIVKLAESAEKILPRVIPYLDSKTNGSVTLSQHQCAVILANMFLGICFEQKLTFYHMLSSSRKVDFEKTKFIMNYFSTLKLSMPKGNVSFRRVFMNPSDVFKKTQLISNIDFHVSKNLRIEEVVGGSQMDFANKYIGGGVLGHGAVQEEIRFLMCPEMIVSMVLCEKMEDTDAIFIVGAQTYSSYSGYSETLKWSTLSTVDLNSNKNIDEYGRIANELIAIDALHFSPYRRDQQFDRACLHREINKLLVGFSAPTSCSGKNSPSPPPISTGWWGCGAFNGDKQLKAMLQVVAATIAGRSLIFCTFGDEQLTKSLYRIVDRLKKAKMTAAQLFLYLIQYRTWSEFRKSSLFDYISHRLNIRQHQIRSSMA